MADPEDEPQGHEFVLDPNEDFLFGVKTKNGTLRFGPAGGALLWSGLTSAAGVVIGALFVLGEFDGFSLVFWDASPAVGRAIGGALVVVVLARLVVSMRSGVRANSEGVAIRSWSRTRHYAWTSITGTRIIESEPVTPFRLGIGEHGHGGGLRADVESSKAYLVLDDRSMVCLRGFEAAAQKSGLAGGSATPTEIKVGALRRYRAAVVGPWPKA